MNTELAKRIESLKKEWELSQPLDPAFEARLWQKLRLEWNYNSNHIEGNTLTYGETQLLLIKGQTTGDHTIREYEEMKAHDLAIAHVRSLAADPRPITETDVRDLNRILLKEPFWKDAITADGQPTRKQVIPGQYKTTANNVRTATGELFFFATPEETPAKMAELVRWFREGTEKEQLDLAQFLAKFHHDFSIIHPFDDGNGRTMRLLVNYALLRRGYLPVVIKSAEKQKYLSALNLADAGDLGSFEVFLAENIEWALDIGVRAAKGESIEEPEDWEKELSLFVQEHLAEAIPAPERTWEMLIQRFEDSWKAVGEAVKAKVSNKLGRLFGKVEVILVVPTPFGPKGSFEFLRFSDNRNAFLRLMGGASSGNPEELIRLDWRISIDGYSGKGSEPFGVSTELQAEFDRFRYRIVGEPLAKHPVTNLRYDQPITSEQSDFISAEVTKALFELLKNKLPQ